MAEIQGLALTGAEIGAVLGLTDRRVRQLAESGAFTRTSRGRYPLVETVQAYLAMVEARGDDDELRRWRVEYLKASTRRVELDNERREATAQQLDAQAAAVETFAIVLLLRLRPLADWLHKELTDRGDADATEVAGLVQQWIVGARQEIEELVGNALAEARRREMVIGDFDTLMSLIGKGDDVEPVKAKKAKPKAAPRGAAPRRRSTK